MTTTAQLAEARAATKLYQEAVAALATKAAFDALTDWGDQPSNWTQPQVNAWYKGAVDRSMVNRDIARELGVAFYRLVRALVLGETVPHPGRAEAMTTLADLRREFEAAAGASIPINSRAPDAAIDIDHSLDALLKDTDQLVAEAKKIARSDAWVLGPQYQEKLLSQIEEKAKADDTYSASQAEKDRSDAHAQAGAREAAAEGRIAADGARDVVFDATANDPKALGWARVSDGDPCHFCAMLLSRGAVYKSKASATEAKDGGLFHDNCHCVAVPIFAADQYKNDPQFAPNRQYAEAWKTHAGDWRAFINEERAARRRGSNP